MEGKLKLETLGRHILIEFYNCDEEILKTPQVIEKRMNEAARVLVSPSGSIGLL